MMAHAKSLLNSSTFAPEIVLCNARARDLFLPKSRLVKMATGAKWSEGVVYAEPTDRLPAQILWSDVPNDRLLYIDLPTDLSDNLPIDEPKPAQIFADKSFYANGHAIDLDGMLINCEHGRRCISRTDLRKLNHASGEQYATHTQILVDNFKQRRLNSPNDVAVKSDGSIWFTDPKYGILSNNEGHEAPSEIGGENVYRFDPKTDELTCVINDIKRPNGIAFSPDESTLFVSDTSLTHDDNGNHEIRAYPINVDGKSVGAGRTLISIANGFPDGFGLDKNGNFYSSSKDSVRIFDPTGNLLAQVMVPEEVANVTFAGANFDVLLIAASTSIYAIKLATAGAVQRRLAR